MHGPDSPIPPANPVAALRSHEVGIRTAIERFLTSGRYILGPEVEGFEREFAAFLGVIFSPLMPDAFAAVTNCP